MNQIVDARASTATGKAWKTGQLVGVQFLKTVNGVAWRRALALTFGLSVVAAMIFFQNRIAFAQEKRPEPGSDEDAFHVAQTYVLQRQPQAAERIFFSLAPLKFDVKFAGPGEGVVSDIRVKIGDTVKPDDVVAVVTVGKNTVELRAETHGKVADIQVKTDDKVQPDQLLVRFGPGYGPAHYEVAVRLLLRREKPADLVAIVQHLRRAVAFNKEPYASLAHEMLYEIYRGQNRPEEAEQELVAAVKGIGDKQPKLRIKLAEWYVTNGKKELAERQLEPATLSYERRLGDNLDDHDARNWLIQCLTMSGTLKSSRGDYKKAKEDFDRGRIMALQGMELVANTPIARQYAFALERAVLAQYDATANDPGVTPAWRFALLEQAANLLPGDLPVLQRLVVYVRLEGPEGKKAKKLIQDVVDSNTKASALAHLFLGIDAWKHDEIADAKDHWEKAFALSDGAPLIANNLAWVLATHPPVDLERALTLINEALKKEDRPEYHGTRGHILAKMEKYREAKPELELAIPTFQNDAEQGVTLYRQLETVYRKLGLEGHAKHAKELADQLQKKVPNVAPKASGDAGPIAPE